MKKILKEIYSKYKKIVILAIIGIALIIIGKTSWDVYFSKVKIFKEEEKLFSNTVKRYYEYHSQKLPRKNESRTLTLQDLYDMNLIDDLYVPKSTKLCDVNNSRVRVYQSEDGKYIYNVYLKCGSFESNVDHNGPEITLKGEEKITLALNSEFVDPGILEVVDNKDGKMDVNKVTIDKSKLNMNKVGSYKITYTISDSSYNKTVKTRTILVKENLTEIVKSNTGETGYYQGNIDNNYLLFSGLLWRIVNVNSDGTIKIVTDENISMITYSAKDTEYKDSNIREWLNNLFYNSLNNPNDYIVTDASWCLDETDDINYKNTECSNVIKDTVGTITLADYNNTLEYSSTFLDDTIGYFLLTKKDNNTLYTIVNAGESTLRPANTLYSVRPSIVLKADLYTISSDGTFNKPYRLGDYSTGKTGDMLNTRLIGEYVNYSGMLFRISDIDKDNNIKLTGASILESPGAVVSVAYGDDEEESESNDSIILFDVENETSIGYKLNKNLIDYIDETLIIKHNYKVYEYNPDAKYSSFKLKNTFNAKLSIPSTFDLFSSKNSKSGKSEFYYLLDYVNDESYILNKNRSSESKYNDIKLVIYITNKAKIKKGKGTYTNPYYIN